MPDTVRTTPPDPASEAVVAPPSSRARRAFITFAVATVIGLALASQTVLAMTSFGRSITWFAAITNLLRDSWIWAALVPAVFAIAGRFPIRPESWGRSLAAHVVGAMVICLSFSVLNIAVIEWLTPEHLRPSNVFSSRRQPAPSPSPSPSATIATPPPPGASAGPTAGGGGDVGVDRPGHSPTAHRQPPKAPSLSQRFWFGFASRIQPNLFSYALIVAIWHWLDHDRRLRERERHSRDLSRQLAEARLQALRMQLNPHFLFNTLNAIATLVHRDPAAADEMIACLSDFLRLTLNSQNQPESPLRTELEFAHRYLDIEKVRFGERLAVAECVEPDCLAIPVPTLVLQPLLENAIRHGIERSEENGRIDLEIRRDPSRELLLIRIGNTGPARRPHPVQPAVGTPLPPTPASSTSSNPGGVGLANTRARLRELHGDSAALDLTERPEGGLDVELRIPWLPPSPPPQHPPDAPSNAHRG